MPKPLGATIDGDTVERGSVVSIDLTRQPVLGVPGFQLSPMNPTATIPSDISDESLTMLRRAYDSGLILLSSEPVGRPIPKDPLKAIFNKIDAVNHVKELAPVVHDIMKNEQRHLQLTNTQLFRLIIEFEAAHQCRDAFINWFMSAIDKMGGVSEVQHEIEPPAEYNVMVEKVPEKELEDLF